MSDDVIPNDEDGRKSWAENMALKFPPVGASLGFSAAEITSVVDDCEMMRFAITSSQSAAGESKARTAYKRAILDGVPQGSNAPPLPLSTLPAPPAVLTAPGVIGRLRAVIARVKTSPNYNQSVGEQLQIASGAGKSGGASGGIYGAIYENAKPPFKAVASVGAIVLNWTKGAFDGVQIEQQRGGETAWTPLDKDFKSPYTDTRPNLINGQPEQRRYRLIYLLDDQIVGTYSDTVNVNTV